MEISAPTFDSLNKSQKRALILRDQLRFVEPQHLNSFIEGLSNDEPPTYTLVNGVIKPELVFVTLKEEASRFDLGNVILPEEKNSVHRVYLVVEDGQVQMSAEDPLPLDENVLDSLPIHGFIARSTVPLFKEKFHTIYTRMKKINEARRAAYSMPTQAPVLFNDGETLARLDPVKAERDRSVNRTRKSRKRRPNDKVIPHVSNKRKCAGLDVIPEDVKSNVFNTIPSHIKVDLFNSVAKTAFPNFNNLMIAAWNVVTIYSACGSDFPELHTAIVDLKSVLQDFDETFGERVDRATPSYRHDFGGPPKDGKDGKDGDGNQDRDRTRNQRHHHDHQDHHGDPDQGHSGTYIPPFVQNGAGTADQLGDTAADGSVQYQDDADVPANNGEHINAVVEPQMSPPSASQSAQLHGGSESDIEDDEDDDEVPPVDPRLTHRYANQNIVRRSHSKCAADTHEGGSLTTSAKSSPGPQYSHVAREDIQDLPEQHDNENDAENDALIVSPAAGSELARRREEYASSIRRTPQGAASDAKISAISSPQNAATPEPSVVDEADSRSEYDQPVPQLYDSPPAIPTSTSPSPPKRKKKHRNPEYNAAQLEKKYQERKDHILFSFQNDLTKVPDKSRKMLLDMETTIEQRKKWEAEKKANKRHGKSGETSRPGTASGGMFGNFLGNSLLGVKKPTGVAPVANMTPNTNIPKDSFPNGTRKDPRDSVAKDAPRKERVQFKYLKKYVNRMSD